MWILTKDKSTILQTFNDKPIFDNGSIVYPIQSLEITEDMVIELDNIDGFSFKYTIEVPQSITPRQARIILLQNGLLDDVEEAVKTNREFEIYWEYSLEINRNDAVLIQMAEALGISSEMLDSMFIEGSKL